MYPPLGRSVLVASLVALTGLARMGLRPPESRPLTLPTVAQLTAGSGWRAATTQVSHWGMAYRQWTLRNAQGQVALLYLGVTSRVQDVVHWSGELGYQGEGYLVGQRSVQGLQLPDGATATISVVPIQRMRDRRLLAYAVVGRDHIAARGSDDLLSLGWDVLRGSTGPYYLVRASAPLDPQGTSGATVVLQLLRQVLPVVAAQARADAR